MEGIQSFAMVKASQNNDLYIHNVRKNQLQTLQDKNEIGQANQI